MIILLLIPFVILLNFACHYHVVQDIRTPYGSVSMYFGLFLILLATGLFDMMIVTKFLKLLFS